jgi:hypothetical protein
MIPTPSVKKCICNYASRFVMVGNRQNMETACRSCDWLRLTRRERNFSFLTHWLKWVHFSASYHDINSSFYVRLHIQMCVKNKKVKAGNGRWLKWTERFTPYKIHIGINLLPVTISQWNQFHWMVYKTFASTNSHLFALWCHFGLQYSRNFRLAFCN